MCILISDASHIHHYLFGTANIYSPLISMHFKNLSTPKSLIQSLCQLFFSSKHSSTFDIVIIVCGDENLHIFTASKNIGD